MVSTVIKRFWPLIALLALFAGSIGLRWQSFSSNPVTDHLWTVYQRFNNLEVYEHINYVGQVYDANPVGVHKFAGYIGSSGTDFLQNKHLGADGYPLTVYTSFPPTHFVVLYEVLKLFGSPITFFGMQLFSLFLHLVCIVLVYYLCLSLTKNKYVSFLGATTYIFSTGTLQQHMNVYWAHQLLMPVFLGSLIVFVKRRGFFKKWEALVFGFSMALIAWTGLFAVLGYSVYAAHQWLKTKNKAYSNYLYMIGGAAGALVLIVLQALWVTNANLWEYITKVSTRASFRSTGAGHSPLPQIIWLFVNDLMVDFGVYAIIAWTLGLIRRLQGFEWSVLFVAAFPVIESFFLLEHDEVYGFGRLKWLVPIIVVLALCGAKYAKTRKQKIIFTTAVVLANLIHAGLYLVVYRA